MVIVVMGVSGSGKSTIGGALADALGWDFQEGDDLHPQANIDKMSAGIALDDQDRRPWLDRVGSWISAENAHGQHGVMTCSALKRSYRDHLRQAGGDVRFVYLSTTSAELEHRTRSRLHFMPASLLGSQLQTLETPSPAEGALTVSADETVGQVLARIRHWLAAGT